jgi:lactoylglutathione lyase
VPRLLAARPGAGRNSAHLAYAVENIYDTSNAFIARTVSINRPPRDGRSRFQA